MKVKIEKFIHNNKFIVIIDNKVAYLDLDIPINVNLNKKVEYRDVKLKVNELEIIKIQFCKTRFKNYICGVFIKGEKLNKEEILNKYDYILNAVKMVI